jgi:hypothetical protein
MTATGVILSSSTRQDFPYLTPTKLEWDAADHMNGSKTFWTSGTPESIIVPSGVDYLKFFWGGRNIDGLVPVLTSDFAAHLYDDNGSTPYLQAGIDNSGYWGGAYASRVIPVSSGDSFSILASRNAGTTGTYSWGGSDGQIGWFACFTPDSVVGAVRAQLASDTNITSGPTLSWDTPSIDTQSTHNGTTGFVVPSNVDYANVSYNAYQTSGGAQVGATLLKVDGTTVRQFYVRDNTNRGRGCPFGPIAVSTGDVITINATRSGYTLDADWTFINIEWLG